MNKKDEEIQRKLEELENTILKETSEHHPNTPSTLGQPTLLTTTKTGSTASEGIDIKNDLCYFGGIASILLGLFLLFQHVRIGTGMFAMFGMGGGQGFGLFLIPLMVGIGWLMYDSKAKIAWLLTGGTCAVIVLTILMSLIMSFPSLSLFQTILMLTPLALGGALLLKGVGGPKAIQEKLKKSKS